MTLLRKIEQHLRVTGIAPTRFGREVVGDPRFVLDMRRMGRTPTPRIERKVEAYLTGRTEQPR